MRGSLCLKSLPGPRFRLAAIGCSVRTCWLHALKYAQDVSTNNQTEKTLGSINAFWAISPVRSRGPARTVLPQARFLVDFVRSPRIVLQAIEGKREQVLNCSEATTWRHISPIVRNAYLL